MIADPHLDRPAGPCDAAGTPIYDGVVRDLVGGGTAPATPKPKARPAGKRRAATTKEKP